MGHSMVAILNSAATGSSVGAPVGFALGRCLTDLPVMGYAESEEIMTKTTVVSGVIGGYVGTCYEAYSQLNHQWVRETDRLQP